MAAARIVRGPLFRDGRFEDDRWVAVRDGLVESVGRGPPPGRAETSGVLVPTFVNAHTHVGDRFLRGKVPEGASLAEIVAPPHGLKHRALAAASRAELVASAGAALDEARAAGVSVVVDFREGGAEGCRVLAEAAAGARVRALAFGRPTAKDGPDDVLDAAYGLGLPSLADVAADAAAAQARAAAARGRPLALHWSEGSREDVAAALDLRPRFLVHAVHADASDAERLADASIPVVLCPRSNARLVGRLPPARLLADASVPLLLGTDNAMLQTASVLDELAAARALLPDLSPDELLAAAFEAPRLAFPDEARPPFREGEPARFLVLASDGPDPRAAVLGGAARILARFGDDAP